MQGWTELSLEQRDAVQANSESYTASDDVFWLKEQSSQAGWQKTTVNNINWVN